MKWLRRIRNARAYDRVCGPLTDVPERRHYRRVIVKTDRLGDFLLAAQSIRIACSGVDAGECLLVISPSVDALAQLLLPEFPRLVVPLECSVRKDSGTVQAVRQQLSAITCDDLVCLRHQRNEFNSLCIGWVQAAKRHGIAQSASDVQGWLLRRERRLFGFPGFCPPQSSEGIPVELFRHFAVVQGLGVGVGSARALLTRFTPEDVQAEEDVLVVAPFGSGAIRDIPEHLLLRLLRDFARRMPTVTRVRLCSDPAQRDKLEALREVIGARYSNWDIEVCCQLSLEAFIELVRRARALISTDTFTAHLAVALDKRALIVIGGGHYGQFVPWGRSERQVWLEHRIPCYHCNWNCIHAKALCIHDINVAVYREQIERALS